MPREPVVVTLGIFYISNLLYRKYANAEVFSFYTQSSEADSSVLHLLSLRRIKKSKKSNSGLTLPQIYVTITVTNKKEGQIYGNRIFTS